jgi:phospholipid transport system substrate-binding protein
MKTLAATLAILLLTQPTVADGGLAQDQVRQSVENLLTILKNPQLKGERKKNERRSKLKEVIYQRFDFTEMAKRSLGSYWRRLSPEEKKQFITLFTALLEDAYLDEIESYNGEKVLFVKERQDNDYAEVDTKIVDNKGREFAVDYRLYNLNGDWKVYDVLIEDVSLVNNYRAQFNRVLARESFDELLTRMRGKRFSAPAAKS